MNFADSGMGFAFPLQSTVSVANNKFIIDFTWPLAVGVPKSGSAKFYGGNPRLSFLGSWRFTIPFAEGFNMPAAWAVGADLGIPFAGIWGGNIGMALSYPMYLHDYAAWLPEFGLKPKALLAMGEPMFFAEFELSLPGLLVSMNQQVALLIGWGLALGTQPLDWFSMMFEIGGLHNIMDRKVFVNANPVWGATSFRFYLGKFSTGLNIRFPFVKAYGSEIEAPASVSIFIGYEMRRAKN
ncbi:MAG: hypothetical protein JRJ19_11610 [Deltaproteobacteria bacterium]|nr:hypothetical protein [Deltaproteobacteria bacterium]